MNLKKTVRCATKKYQEQRKKQLYFSRVNQVIRSSDPQLPDLSESEKNEIKTFWSGYGIDTPYQWHRLFYGKTGMKVPEFVAVPVFNLQIRPAMNRAEFAGVWSDKCYLDKFITEKTAEPVLRNVNGRFLDRDFQLISTEKAQTILDGHKEVVVKPSTFTHTGMGVKLLRGSLDLATIMSEYKKNYIIQLPVKQHPCFAQLNESSVNTIRVNTVLLDDEAYVMSSFVKAGKTGEFADNAGEERMFIGITEDGHYREYAVDPKLNIYQRIPCGFQFAGEEVPFYDEICAAAVRAHKCIPHFGFAFWDICVDAGGDPVIIEANLRNPSVTIAQATGSPFLGRYTDQIMNYIHRHEA
ncbi:MAG: hypothetical protein LUE92_13270 [Clostridiales bacterium]|nr:hypothetical protein [Clostridiales bacterium]